MSPICPDAQSTLITQKDLILILRYHKTQSLKKQLIIAVVVIIKLTIIIMAMAMAKTMTMAVITKTIIMVS